MSTIPLFCTGNLPKIGNGCGCCIGCRYWAEDGRFVGQGIQALAEEPLARFGLGDHLQLQQGVGQVDILFPLLGAAVLPLARHTVEPAGEGKLGQV